jgi:polyhydroxyalkanoate synthesis regulator phasin
MPDILETLKKTMLTGIGLALKTKDEVEDLARELSQRLNLSEIDGKKFLSDLQQRYDEAQEVLESRVERAVREFMKKADVVTGDELKSLKKEIRELKQAISAPEKDES